MTSPLVSGTPPPVTKLPIVNLRDGLPTLTFTSFLQQVWNTLIGIVTPVTVAQLPAQPYPAGARLMVSDALGPVFGAPVVGGGAVTVGVTSDNVNWNVG